MFNSYTHTLLICLACCFVQVVAFGQTPDWRHLNPLPTGTGLNDVEFINEQSGWIVGNAGTIIKTTNGGSTWTVQNLIFTIDFSSVDFIDEQTGWVGGGVGTDAGFIYKTTNGGESWNAVYSLGANGRVIDIQFLNSQIGYAVGSRGLLMKTSNGGINWVSFNVGLSNDFVSVHFIDVLTGWVINKNGNVVFTTDGGTTWESTFVNSTFSNFNDIFFTDANTGWLVGDRAIYKSTDGGNNWTFQNRGPSSMLTKIFFINPTLAWGLSSNLTTSRIEKSIDGFTTYSTQSILGGNAIHFINAQTGWVVGNFGRILRTTNGGDVWEDLSSTWRTTLYSVFFINDRIGWATGSDPFSGNWKLHKTTNSGRTWSINNNLPFFSLFFINQNKGWGVGQGGIIYTSNNGGSNWTRQLSGTIEPLRSVQFINSQTGWIVGDRGVIRKTTNGGTNWVSQNSGTTTISLRSVHFLNANTGWIVGNGVILKTTNGGDTWIAQNGGNFPLRSVYFVNEQEGWAVGNGFILRTLNGGNTWIRQSSPVSSPLLSVKFTDLLNGFIVGDGGVILKTVNGGGLWTRQPSGTTNNLNSLFMVNNQLGFIGGVGGTLLTIGVADTLSKQIPATSVFGTLFKQSGTACDPSYIPVSGKLIKADPGPYYAISNQNGNYDLRVPLADSAVNFTLQPVETTNPALRIETVCPPSGQIQVRVDTIPDTLSGNNFGFEITPCHHLDVQLSSNRRRRCFTNSTAISYFNQGAITAPNAYVQVEFPKWVKPLRASRSYLAVNDSVWQFNLGDVAPGTGGQISITDSVLCGNVDILGISQCTKATIYPAPNCPPPTAWSGAEVSISTRCLGGGFAEVGIYNRTTINMPDSVAYFIYLDSIEVKTGKVKLVAGDSLKYRVENTGYDVHAMAIQVAHHPTQAFVSQSLEGCIATIIQPGGIAMNYAIQQQPNSKTQCLPIIGAYDPNDKQVFPLGFTANRIVPPNTKLEYLVRFQNTGNDTAFTVYLIDTLHTNLNVESFEMGAASHPYQLSMQTTKSGKTWLRWQFNNIRLPDSNVNEPKSHGFVQFRISPKANLPLGTQVFNEADIYFDFNPPILTNQTLTTFDIIRFTDTTLNRNVRVILPTGIPVALRNAMKLYPNPVTNNQLNINFAEAASLTLYDARGQVVYSKANLIGEHTLPVSLKRGMYVARIAGAAGSWSEKVVVE